MKAKQDPITIEYSGLRYTATRSGAAQHLIEGRKIGLKWAKTPTGWRDDRFPPPRDFWKELNIKT